MGTWGQRGQGTPGKGQQGSGRLRASCVCLRGMTCLLPCTLLPLMGLLFARTMAWTSSGKTHPELINNLYSEKGIIKSQRVFEVLLATDRGHYIKYFPYMDSPQSIGYKATIMGDGRQGYPEEAPYDAIHVGAAAPTVPKELLEELKPGGRLILPLGAEGGSQVLMQYDKGSDGQVTATQLMGVIFVPLTDKEKQWPGDEL
ncbi:LOW QUALITY PROTEIN: protein-L-isoaspartate(D-aspartate) O-methyltransferase [Calypte anna]|uniref:LOW QUALITY PROTEIN: protein-L-isoaspartate(D-aspartate) O-methyltransferase n=1 Tax=Calypte anna TaxID=9244 RepID=UPI0011C460E4|nr:LOW QUALITY PROTEIN: protein-L-isoaspartate(D-aspartate) O-methyltransferase [Calypte anna]